MAEAARKVVALCSPLGIDINMGCPAPKIVKNGEGSALMRDPQRAYSVVSAVARAVDVPVTVKFRRGFALGENIAVEFGKGLEQSGAAALCLHGRTREQMYSGPSDRDTLRALKEAVSVPVIASGDAWSGALCNEILAETGVDFIMIARGALGNPWIFSDCLAVAAGEEPRQRTTAELVEVMMHQSQLTCQYKGEGRAMAELRKHLLWYLDRLQKGKTFKAEMAQVQTLAQLQTLCQTIVQSNLQMKER